MAYVYRHRRLDNNSIFYIGIGSNDTNNFKRAYQKIKSRNPLWKNIINKTDYIIEILADNILTEDAKELECFLIELYGRRDLNTGILCNMTDGGDGNINMSQITKDKISKSLTGKKHSDETKLKLKTSLIEAWKCPILRELKRQQSTELAAQGKISKKGIPSKKKGIPISNEQKEKLSKSLKNYYKTNDIHNKIILDKIILDKIIEDYIQNNLSEFKLSKLYNLNRKVIRRILIEQNILKEKIIFDIEKFDKLYIQDNNTIKQMCIIYNCSEENISRIIKKYKIYKNGKNN